MQKKYIYAHIYVLRLYLCPYLYLLEKKKKALEVNSLLLAIF